LYCGSNVTNPIGTITRGGFGKLPFTAGPASFDKVSSCPKNVVLTTNQKTCEIKTWEGLWNVKTR
jgi:hypothetical protein